MRIEPVIAFSLGVASVFVVWFVIVEAKKGWKTFAAKVDALWNGATNKLAADVAAVKADIVAIKGKLGL